MPPLALGLAPPCIPRMQHEISRLHRMWSSPRRLLLFAFLALACDSTTPTEDGTLTLVSGFAQADTVLATLSVPLLVELTMAGRPAAGVEVVFTAVSRADVGRGVELGRNGAFSSELRATTDAQGHAAASLRFAARVTQRASVLVSVPRWGVSDTAFYDLLPGKPVSLQRASYTAVAIGDSARYSPLAFDSHGNRSHGVIECTATTHVRVAAGCMLHGVRFGPALITLHAGGSTLVDTGFVVPRGQLAVSNHGIELVSTDGLAIARFEGVSNPAWTPRGDSLLFADSSLWIATLGNSRRALSGPLAGGNAESDPAMSPDGEWVYFSAGTSDQLGAEIWRVRRDGTSPVRIGPRSVGGRHDSRPHVSPDGAKLMYQSCSFPGCPTPHVQLLDLRTGELLDFGPGSSPRIAPDGQVFAAERSGRLSIEPMTGGILTQYLVGVRWLEWSPDGKYIVFTADITPTGNGSEFGLFMVELATGEIIRLRTLSAPVDRRPLPTTIAWRPQ